VIGLSTGVYALALAGVAAAQAAHDRAVVADRQPMQTAITLLGSAHDRMQRSIDAARAGYTAAAGGYDQATERLISLQAGLERLAAVITGIEGTSFSLPGRISLPSVPGVRPVAAAPATPAAPAAVAPTTVATTGASGAP
jgi:hypothetical protein